MIALETGNAFAYAIDKLQDRGKFFIDPGEDVYMGQVVGEHVHDNDLVINVCKAKQLTNVRASGTDDKARIIPKVVMSLEECLEVYQGRRTCRGYSEINAYAQDNPRPRPTKEGKQELNSNPSSSGEGLFYYASAKILPSPSVICSFVYSQ